MWLGTQCRPTMPPPTVLFAKVPIAVNQCKLISCFDFTWQTKTLLCKSPVTLNDNRCSSPLIDGRRKHQRCFSRYFSPTP